MGGMWCGIEGELGQGMTFQTINLYQDVLKPPRKPREDVLFATGIRRVPCGFPGLLRMVVLSSNRLGAAVKSAEDSKLTLRLRSRHYARSWAGVVLIHYCSGK